MANSPINDTEVSIEDSKPKAINQSGTNILKHLLRALEKSDVIVLL